MKSKTLTKIKIARTKAVNREKKVLAATLTALLAEIDLNVKLAPNHDVEKLTQDVLKRLYHQCRDNILTIEENLGKTLESDPTNEEKIEYLEESLEVFKAEFKVYNKYLPKMMEKDKMDTLLGLIIDEGVTSVGEGMKKFRELSVGEAYDSSYVSDTFRFYLFEI